MTTANLTLHSQRSSNPGATEESTGQVFAGVDVDSQLNSALRFAPPADIAGATITSVTLTVRAKAVEITGGPLVKFAIAANTGNLSSQNLASTAETNHDFLHTDTFEFGNDPVPADSQKVTSTYSSYTLDLTESAIVANMEDDIIVLCQHSLFTQMIGDDESGHITFDGVGETSPATLEIVYTPVSSDQTITPGVSTEIESGPPSSAINPRTYASGTAAETESAPASIAAKTIASGITSEAESAPASATMRTTASGVSSETESAPASTIRRDRIVPSGIAAEIESGLASIVQKDQTIAAGITTEIESGPSSLVTVPQTIASGIATEIESAPTSSNVFGQVVSSGIAAEIESAPTSVVQKNKTIVSGIATETESAPSSVATVSGGGLLRQFFHHLAG